MKKIILLSVTALLVVLSLPKKETTSFVMPLFAQTEEQSPDTTVGKSVAVGGTDETIPWLHVTVETKYTWFSQTSTGKAWTTRTRESEEKVNVGKLCIKLDAHKIVESCVADTNYVEVKDTRKRVATKKKEAVVTAWAENPAIEATTVRLQP